MMRLDKILCDASVGTRTECDKLIRRGIVCVDGDVIRKPDMKIDEKAEITVNGIPLNKHRDAVCVMNKPQGYVTSTEDPRDLTVMTLLPDEYAKLKVIPAGRLDKDTEGLLVFSNDGNFIHKLISPKSMIPKTYYVEYDGQLQNDAVERAGNGIVLKDGTVCRSADLVLIESGKSQITVTEGLYHQVKRMYAALGCRITLLKRIKIGKYELGELAVGEVRELTEDEISRLLNM